MRFGSAYTASAHIEGKVIRMRFDKEIPPKLKMHVYYIGEDGFVDYCAMTNRKQEFRFRAAHPGIGDILLVTDSTVEDMDTERAEALGRKLKTAVRLARGFANELDRDD